MPPRLGSKCTFHRAHLAPLRSRFHTSPPSASSEPTHYETFDIHHGATPADIKRRFYELSKKHHPDRNRNDPHAARRFVRINTAYAVIGNVKNREKYDRELQQRHGHRVASSPAAARTGPTGGRPASGLSKRRTQFYGPPPSFFRNSRWNTAKGASSGADGAAAGATGGGTTSGVGGGGFGVGGGGFGVGGSPFGKMDDVPHFNYEQKYRQHEHFQRRQASRRSPHTRYEPGGSIIGSMIGVCSILVLAVALTSYSKSKMEEKARLNRVTR